MANARHVKLLKQDVEAWNAWREKNSDIRPDLSEADLRRANLSEANLSGAMLHKAKLWLANLSGANLSRANLLDADLRAANLSGAHLSGAQLGRAHLSGGAHLSGANLSEAKLSGVHLNGQNLSGVNLSGHDLIGADFTGANLSGAKLRSANLDRASFWSANLSGADLGEASLRGANLYSADLNGANLYRARLYEADLHKADLRKANLSGAELAGVDLNEADLSGANVQEADLRRAVLVDTDLNGADLTGCRIYGISAWGLKLEGTKQQNLVITPYGEPEITVDDIEVAQFIYLMLNNRKIRNVIDTITSKAVLILGRFTDERKAVLDALREELRKRNYLPILFDFDVPATRDITETVSLLARMARFIVADITDAKSIPQELAVIVPNLPSVPVQPLLLEASAEYSMFEHFRRYPWVLETYTYPSSERLIADLGDKVIRPAEEKVLELRG